MPVPPTEQELLSAMWGGRGANDQACPTVPDGVTARDVYAEVEKSWASNMVKTSRITRPRRRWIQSSISCFRTSLFSGSVFADGVSI